MEDNKEQQQFITGYNNGYLLSRFQPKLYTQIVRGLNKQEPYVRGMVEGNRALERELFEQNLKKSQTLNQQVKPRLK